MNTTIKDRHGLTTPAGVEVLGPIGDGYAGILTQDALVRGLTAHDGSAAVASVMLDPPPPVDARVPVAELLERLTATARMLPVVEAGRLVGVVTADNVFELLRFRAAQAAGARRDPRAVARPLRAS